MLQTLGWDDLEDACLLPSSVPSGTIGVKNKKIYPSECRQRGGSYKGRFVAQVSWSVNGSKPAFVEKDFGEIPIMVKSNRCHLEKLSPQELIRKGEHEDEWGGYFIVGGHERLIRMLILTRRNYPLALCRSSWQQRGQKFSDKGVLIRCVREDQTAANNVLHFVNDGSAKLMFSHKRSLYYVPVVLILKCLSNVTDEFIFRQLVMGFEEDEYYKGCVREMLTACHANGLHTVADIKTYIGKTFRAKLTDLPPHYTDADVCDYLIRRCVLIHLDNSSEKFNLLVMMVQKLYSFVQGKCRVESVDTVMSQEVLLGGHLYLQVLKDRLQSWLTALKITILKKTPVDVKSKFTSDDFQKALKYTGKLDSGVCNFISTGNIRSSTGLGLMQDKGLTIVVENINRMRYMSHFRAVHRGSFFQEMRTTEGRQLLPDAWGFICPVHTPDGTPCGLLNHLTKYCRITNVPNAKEVMNIPSVLVTLGMIPLNSPISASCLLSECYLVMLDGRILGHVPMSEAKELVTQLRYVKIEGKKVPETLEIAFVPKLSGVGQYPGLYLFTGPARMMRPVINLSAQKVELIGTFEQVYMDICIIPEEAYPGITTHMEISKTSFLSNLACLIPMPDCNQSPRNMYQCQMGKQTMGTPCHTWHLQSEVKLYRLQTPTSPLFRPVHHDLIGLDDFGMGINAIVAVISYTGYDMEDAMVINKASYERGLGHGMIYKSMFVELPNASSYFGLNPVGPDNSKTLDSDGLPRPGARFTEGDIVCSYYDAVESKFRVERWKGTEDGYVDNVRLCGVVGTTAKQKACITFRVPRNPSVGDKFASRAGQKGICSQKWPSEDLPFTETGIVPDIVFNPHGFPSRMTIAMMIELMAGKSAAIHGLVHDATPFKFSEKDTAIDFFGRMLEAGGYNYYGTEKMYSGVDGREMTAAIFFGVVHYQRLRHMVSDKWQVRSTGPVDVLTQQPVKGRRRGGGVRFGEMERDSLISHGASFLLQDRLFHCSDKTTSFICRTCGNILSTLLEEGGVLDHTRKTKCQLCGDKGQVEEIEIPYIYRYLVTQLASVNINLKMEVVEE
ncbi:DNA-directed RNA polymerase I subunit RPA2 isoform X2 [Anabrus simplex]|uniref:DNA-directed RNA polymerase I subunit RPA2 isoform X2 n=1 Tax=Anabrus simplex TaxID=316456 RepID=UPI0035A29AE5